MKYLILNIKALEPLKLSDNGLEDTLNSISGSMIKGAFLKSFANGKILKEGDEIFRKFQELLMEKDLFFYDGYLIKDEKYFIPSPLCFIANKHDLKSFSEDNEIVIKNVFFEKFEESDVSLDKFDYCLVEDKNMNVSSVDIRETIHITKKMDEGNIFRYQAIEKNQEFYALIKGKAEMLDEVKKHLNNKEMYIGGSKGTGYGKVKMEIKEIEDFSKFKEVIGLNSRNEKNKLYVYFYTKAMIKDKNGNTVASIPCEYLEEKLGIKNVILIKQIVKTFNISGYNRTWNTALPKDSAIKEGSIMEFSYEGQLDEKKAFELEKSGIGYMKDRGFGQIIINLDFTEIKNIKKYKKYDKKQNELEYKEISDSSYKMILKNIILEKEQKFIDRRIIDLQKSGEIRINVLNNQIKKVLEVVKKGKDGKFRLEDIDKKVFFDDREKFNLFGDSLKNCLNDFSKAENKLIGKENYKRKDLADMKLKIFEKDLFRTESELAKEILLGLFYYKTRSNEDVNTHE